MGPTVTLIKNDKGKEFGGFTKVSWDSSSTFKDDKEAFLFSLTANQKFTYKQQGKAIYCGSSNGPYFGDG